MSEWAGRGKWQWTSSTICWALGVSRAPSNLIRVHWGGSYCEPHCAGWIKYPPHQIKVPVQLLYSLPLSRSLNFSSGLSSTQHKPNATPRKKIHYAFQGDSHPSHQQTPLKVNTASSIKHELIPPISPALFFQSPAEQLYSLLWTSLPITKWVR